MFFMLVFIAGAVIAEAGITHEPNGFSIHHPISNSVRPATRSQFANPVGLNPALSHGSVVTNTFVSPTVFKSAIYSNTAHAPKFRPLPTSYVSLRPTSTMSHISAPIFRNSFGPSLNSYVLSPVLNSSPISHVIRPAILPNVQTPNTEFTSAPIHHPSNGPGLTNSEDTLNSISSYKTVHEVQEVPEKSISYTLSEQDYQYLKKYKDEGQESPYSPDFVSDSASSNQHKNTHRHHETTKDTSSSHPLSSDGLKRSAAPSQAYPAYAEPNIGNTPEPVVFKHIYFHVPQPEFEEPPPTVNLPPPKKTYNILFIKAPTQESQNYAYLQQQQQPQIEDKTLIYVLSKKQDPVPVVVPQQEIRPSSPEVYFVKYQTKSGDVDPRNIGSVLEENAIESISSGLDRKRSVEKKPDCKTEKKTSL